MNYIGFSKILKKHDKLTQHETRSKFMRNRVHKHPFANYQRLSDALRGMEALYRALSALSANGKRGGTGAAPTPAPNPAAAAAGTAAATATGIHTGSGRAIPGGTGAARQSGGGNGIRPRPRLPTEDEKSLARIESIRAHSAAEFMQGQQELRQASLRAASEAAAATAAGGQQTGGDEALKRKLGAKLGGEDAAQGGDAAGGQQPLKRQRHAVTTSL